MFFPVGDDGRGLARSDPMRACSCVSDARLMLTCPEAEELTVSGGVLAEVLFPSPSLTWGRTFPMVEGPIPDTWSSWSMDVKGPCSSR